MSIMSLIKGKLKQREVRKLEPDTEFKFEENYYDTDILDGFSFIYCNNYTDKFCKSSNSNLSFISCVISLPSELKVIADMSSFVNEIFSKNYFPYFRYKNIWIQLGLDKTKGSIALGKDADFAIIDKDLNVYMTVVKGKVVYKNI